MKGIPIFNVEYKRFLRENEASRYLGMTVTEFRRDCPVAPELRAQGRKVWDVVELDCWHDGQKQPVEGGGAGHADIIARLT